jgi:hypothetical protein
MGAEERSENMDRDFVRRVAGLVFAMTAALAPAAASAVPARIILLRHGEKQPGFGLCSVGISRGQGLAQHHLGQGTPDSLFAAGEAPAAFFAITPHTVELATPAANAWNLPVITYPVMPWPQLPKPAIDRRLDLQTQAAAHDILENPAWAGRTVVMVWEHDHIANAGVEAAAPGERVTLRQLLNLDRLPDADKLVPRTWPDGSYNFFWVIEYDPASTIPTGFRSIKQVFPGFYADLPHNDWGMPDGLRPISGCL